MVREVLRGKVTFRITPIGATGGGAMADMPRVGPG